MNSDIKILDKLVERMLAAQCDTAQEKQQCSVQCRPIVDKLDILFEFLAEVQTAAAEIAAGNFESTLNKNNPYAGALKDLQASFHHLTWQISRVAEGDYEQSVDYLGEVSEAFNKMILQLREREALLEANLKLTEELAQQRTKLLEQEIKNQEERYNQFSKSVTEIRAYQHDMKNHLLCIDALLASESIEEAQKYVDQLTSVFKSKKELFHEKNYVLNMLLNDKMEKARQLGVEVKAEVKISRTLKIDNIDWCILFGNALDNALEALSKVPQEQRRLEISVKNTEEMLCAKIHNSMCGAIIYDENNVPETSKKDKYGHGIGLKNMQNCVKKYHGEMKIMVEKNTFCLMFILCQV